MEKMEKSLNGEDPNSPEPPQRLIDIFDQTIAFLISKSNKL